MGDHVILDYINIHPFIIRQKFDFYILGVNTYLSR